MISNFKKVNKSILSKLFIITTILFFSFITLLMLSQSLFFQKFYYNHKTKTLVSNVLNFKKSLESNYDSNSLFDYAYKFEDENNAKLAILNSSGIIKYIRQPVAENNQSSDAYNKEVIIMALKNWMAYEQSYFDVLIHQKTVHFNFKNPILNTENLVVASPIIVDGKLTDIIFVVSTLQPIGEAFSVIKNYYGYVYLIMLVFMCLLSLFYSKIISKPLIQINKTALKMASLDFSEKCTVNSDDELGTLSKSLNSLSESLDNTLKELKSANENLLKDIEKERALENMRKEFIASVSHELKTPISLIEGYSEGLKDNIVDEKNREFYLDVIIDETKKMNKLVMDMLELSKMESGCFTLDLKPFSIYETINNIFTTFSKKHPNKTLILNCELDKTTSVLADEFRIESVLTNILTNAINYSPDNSNIFIRILNPNKKENIICIEIENSGSHIPTEELKLVWNKFYRIDKSRNKYLGGTGLGLSVIKSILDLHDSQYSIENTELGVKFSFTLKPYKYN